MTPVDTGIWNRGVLWRIAVAAVLSTAATAGVVAFLGILAGQLFVAGSRSENIGLYTGIAGIAALLATALGIAGGLLTAVGSLTGLLIARTAKLSLGAGCAFVGLGGAVGSLVAFGLSHPSLPAWVLGFVGAVVVGVILFGLSMRFVRESAVRMRHQ